MLAARRCRPRRAPARRAGTRLDALRLRRSAARRRPGGDRASRPPTSAKLVRQQVQLDGTVDSSPIYLHAVSVHGTKHDVFFVTTTYGKTEAIDAASGSGALALHAADVLVVRRHAADHDRDARRRSVAHGDLRRGARRARSASCASPTGRCCGRRRVTRDPTHEKLTSSLNFSRGLVLDDDRRLHRRRAAVPGPRRLAVRRQRAGSTTSGTRSARTGTRSSCPARARPATRRSGRGTAPRSIRRPATWSSRPGNAPFNGKHELGRQRARALARRRAAAAPLDAGRPGAAEHAPISTSARPARRSCPAATACRAARTALLRLLQLHTLPGVNATHRRRAADAADAGQARSSSPSPPSGKGSWVFVADDAGTEALRFSGGRLQPAWSNGTGGTSPVVAGGLLYVAGHRRAPRLRPDDGQVIAVAARSGAAHWQSPIVVDGRIALGEGNSNNHATSGVLDIYRLPVDAPILAGRRWASARCAVARRSLLVASRPPRSGRTRRRAAPRPRREADRARLRDRARRRARQALRRRAGGPDRRADERQGRPRRRSSTSTRSSRAAASRACSRWPSTRATRRTTASTSTTPTLNGDTRVVRYLSNGTTAHPVVGQAAPLRQGLRPEPQRRPAAVRPRRAPLLGQRRRRRRGRPERQRPEPEPAVREDHAPERERRQRRAGSSSPTACATRGASRSTARPATSTSATSARTSGRRSTTCRAASRASPTSAGSTSRATTSTTPKHAAADRRPLRRRRSSSTRTRTATARSTAATSTAAPTSRRPSAATSTATTAPAPSGA